MLLAVAQHAGERRQVDTIRLEVKSVHARNRPPQKGSIPPVKIQG